jgi:alkyl hydroperoxide reductase subunit AhpC
MAVLVGKKAPDFSAPAVINGGEIVERNQSSLSRELQWLTEVCSLSIRKE